MLVGWVEKDGHDVSSFEYSFQKTMEGGGVALACTRRSQSVVAVRTLRLGTAVT